MPHPAGETPTLPEPSRRDFSFVSFVTGLRGRITLPRSQVRSGGGAETNVRGAPATRIFARVSTNPGRDAVASPPQADTARCPPLLHFSISPILLGAEVPPRAPLLDRGNLAVFADAQEFLALGGVRFAERRQRSTIGLEIDKRLGGGIAQGEDVILVNIAADIRGVAVAIKGCGRFLKRELPAVSGRDFWNGEGLSRKYLIDILVIFELGLRVHGDDQHYGFGSRDGNHPAHPFDGHFWDDGHRFPIKRAGFGFFLRPDGDLHIQWGELSGGKSRGGLGRGAGY